MKGLINSVLWIIFVISILISIRCLSSNDFYQGIATFLIGIIFCPPIRKWLFDKSGFITRFLITFFVIVISMIWISATIPNDSIEPRTKRKTTHQNNLTKSEQNKDIENVKKTQKFDNNQSKMDKKHVKQKTEVPSEEDNNSELTLENITKRLINGEDWLGCTDKVYFRKLIRYANQNDNEAFMNALYTGIIDGTCTKFKDKEIVYLVEYPMFSGLVKIRRKGQIKEYWTNSEAIERIK